MTGRIAGHLPAMTFRLVFSAGGRDLVAVLWRGRTSISNLNLVILRIAGSIRGAVSGRTPTAPRARAQREADRLRAVDFLLFRKLRNPINRFSGKSRCNIADDVESDILAHVSAPPVTCSRTVLWRSW